MSFQFPANPKDGDIVIEPQPGGGFIKGTYNEVTNTWAVGELPEEPGIPGPPGNKGEPGDKGDPGKGLEVSGIVPSYDDLDFPSNRYLQFWIVADENKIYFSDGFNWIDMGSPIQGPQGEGFTSVTADETSTTYVVTFKGTIPELDLTTPNLKGANGLPGTDGKGWTGTTIDTSNDEYKITFDSDDGLEFTTDNLKGPQGEKGEPGADFTGELPIATAEDVGVVSAGPGLDVDTAGELKVNMDTVESSSKEDETPEVTYALYYKPGYFNVADSGQYSHQQMTSAATVESEGTIDLPTTSNGALVYLFTGSTMGPYFPGNPGFAGNRYGTGLTWSCYAYVECNMEITSEPVFVSGKKTMGVPMVHNFNIGNESRRSSQQPVTKIGQITYPFDTSKLDFKITTSVHSMQRAAIYYGRARVIVIPYRDRNNTGTLREEWQRMTPAERAKASTIVGFNIDPDQLDGSEPYNPIAPMTDEEKRGFQSADLGNQMAQLLNMIDIATSGQYSSGSDYAFLRQKRSELLALQELAGDADDVEAAMTQIEDAIFPYTNFNFTFSPPTDGS